MGEALKLAILLTLKDEASKHLEGVSAKLGGVGKAAMALGGAAVAGIGTLAATVADLAVQGAPLEQVSVAFQKLSGGASQAAANLDAVVRATQGTVPQFEAMQIASKLMSMGLAETDEDLFKIVNTAYTLGKAMDPNTGATAAVENFALMLANQSLPRLDSFGISSGQVRERIDELMESTEGMTRETAFLQATMEIAEPKVALLGTSGQDAATRLGQLRAATADVKDQLAVALTPVLGIVLDALMPIIPKVGEAAAAFSDWATRAIPAVQEAFEDVSPVIQEVIGWIEDNVIPILAAVVEWVQANWPSISEQVGGVLNDVWNAVSTVLNAVKEAWDSNFMGIRDITQTIFDTVYNTVKNALEIIRGVIQVVTSLIRGDWDGVWNGLKRIVIAVWEQIKNTVQTSVNLIRDVLSGVWSVISRAASTAWDTIKRNITDRVVSIRTAVQNTFTGLRDRVSDIWDGIVNAIKAPLNAIIRMINTFIGAWNAIEIRIPGFSIQLPSVNILGQTIGGGTLGWSGATIGTPDIPLIPTLAEGAIITRPTLALVGEAGPEAVVPLRRQWPPVDDAAAREYAAAARALVSAIDRLVETLGGQPRGEQMLREFELAARLA